MQTRCAALPLNYNGPWLENPPLRVSQCKPNGAQILLHPWPYLSPSLSLSSHTPPSDQSSESIWPRGSACWRVKECLRWSVACWSLQPGRRTTAETCSSQWRSCAMSQTLTREPPTSLPQMMFRYHSGWERYSFMAQVSQGHCNKRGLFSSLYDRELGMDKSSNFLLVSVFHVFSHEFILSLFL